MLGEPYWYSFFRCLPKAIRTREPGFKSLKPLQGQALFLRFCGFFLEDAAGTAPCAPWICPCADAGAGPVAGADAETPVERRAKIWQRCVVSATWHAARKSASSRSSSRNERMRAETWRKCSSRSAFTAVQSVSVASLKRSRVAISSKLISNCRQLRMKLTRCASIVL